jgi:hypothetical protein
MRDKNLTPIKNLIINFPFDFLFYSILIKVEPFSKLNLTQEHSITDYSQFQELMQ